MTRRQRVKADKRRMRRFLAYFRPEFFVNGRSLGGVLPNNGWGKRGNDDVIRFCKEKRKELAQLELEQQVAAGITKGS